MHAILAIVVGLVLSLAGLPVAAAVNQVKLVPDSALPGATVSITGRASVHSSRRVRIRSSFMD